MLGEEECVLLRATGDYLSAHVKYLVVHVLEWETHRKTYPDNKWEELTRGTKAEMRRMYRLTEGD